MPAEKSMKKSTHCRCIKRTLFCNASRPFSISITNNYLLGRSDGGSLNWTQSSPTTLAKLPSENCLPHNSRLFLRLSNICKWMAFTISLYSIYLITKHTDDETTVLMNYLDHFSSLLRLLLSTDTCSDTLSKC